MSPPATPKIYHIVHVDRLESIVADGCLWSDAEVLHRGLAGTKIGMSEIKDRRLRLPLASHPGLRVGHCVPFYFCPRSVMLYVIHRANHPSLSYLGGQEPIVHLEADLRESVTWADANTRRWAFTTSNAGSSYFLDYRDLHRLDKVDWDAVKATSWQTGKEGKQAEFLVETSFPWSLISRVGVKSRPVYNQVFRAIRATSHRPDLAMQPRWYY